MKDQWFQIPNDFIRGIGVISHTRREQILKAVAEMNALGRKPTDVPIQIDPVGHLDNGWPLKVEHDSTLQITTSPTTNLQSSSQLQQSNKLPSLRYEQIKKILKINMDDPKNEHFRKVCDFETESPNHTFVAGDGFIVGNCSMAKHAMSVYHSAWMARFDTTVRMLAYPSRSLFETQMNRSLHLDDLSAGQTVIIALMTFLGYNQEDAMIFNRAALDAGKFRNVIYRAYQSVENLIAGYDEKIGFPPGGRENIPPNKRKLYDHVDDTGIAIPGRKVTSGMVLIVKYREAKRTDKEKAELESGSSSSTNSVFGGEERQRSRYEFVNTEMGPSEEGIVHSVVVDRNGQNRKLVRIRIRQMRIPEIGDKLASRHAQKSTVGAVFAPEDIPFTSSGVKPDLIINPHCLTRETLITCQSGLARPISSFPPEGGEMVYSWNKTQSGLMVGRQMELASKGVQDIVQLTLEDGRTLKCTPDHKLLVKTDDVYEYVEAQKIDLEKSRMVMGLEGAVDDPTSEELDQEKTWKLTCHEHEFTMTDHLEREKAMAFARLVGHVCADGSVSQTLDHGYPSIRVSSCVGHIMDYEAMVDDIELITNKRPKDTLQKGIYSVCFPAELARSVARLPGMTMGKKTKQEASWPTFLLDENCPKSILREFLGGLFGGDGHAPSLSSQQYMNNSLEGKRIQKQNPNLKRVGFSLTICKKFLDSFTNKMQQLCEMLKRVGISHVNMGPACEKKYENTYKAKDIKENPRFTIDIQIGSTTEFSKLVGFRYCIHKWCLLTAAVCHHRFLENVNKQHVTVLERSYEIWKRIGISREKAIDRAAKEFADNNVVLNAYYAKPTIGMYKKKMFMEDKKLGQFDYTKIDDVVVFLNKIGCLSWFETNNSTESHYVVTRDMNFIPTFTMKILDRRPAPQEEVFDISVAGNESFVANGAVVSNCLPSRMTIAKLIEIVTSKEAAFSGERVNATAFRDFNLDEFRRNLVQYGFRDSGNELLRNPFTGQYMKGQIFVGPCYYQALRHQVKDKYQMRAKGRVRPVSFQPIGGRKHLGAIRFGEMERDAIIGHGASAVLQDRLCYSSDAYTTVFCKACGTYAVASPLRGLSCVGCGTTANESFVRCTTPHAYNHLIHLLAGYGVKVKNVFRNQSEGQVATR